MQRFTRLLALVFLFAIPAMLIYPPWEQVDPKTGVAQSAHYGWLWKPADARLWTPATPNTLEPGQRTVQDAFSSGAQAAARDAERTRRYQLHSIKMRLDARRLGFQIATAALLAFGLISVSLQSPSAETTDPIP